MTGFGSLWFSSSPFRGKRSTDSSSPAVYKRGGNATNKAEQKQQKQQQQQQQKQKHAAKQPKFQFQTLVFKVQIHCDACMRKVKKAIAHTDGVESISVDLKQKKITVSGHIDQQKLLKRVAKTGKQVELINKDGSNQNNKSNAMDDNNKPLMVLPLDSTPTRSNTPIFSLQVSPAAAESTSTSFMFSDENVNGCSIM